jgi:hypothetical protein
LEEPILRLHISTDTPVTSSNFMTSLTKKDPSIQLELNKSELDAFVNVLEKIEEKLNSD